jgi:hypothetical protein
MDPQSGDRQADPDRGDDEFIFAAPPGWIDLSSDEKAAASPLTLLRQSSAGDQARFVAIDAPPAHASITAVVRRGVLRIAPHTVDELRQGLRPAQKMSFVRGELVTLSKTQAARLDFDDGELRDSWFYVPGRLRTAVIQCCCPCAQLDHYAPLFAAVAVAAAQSAESAPEVWAEVELARLKDPRRPFFRAKLVGFVFLGVVIAEAIGIPLQLDFELMLGAGALLGMIFAIVWAARGGAPMLPGGDGGSEGS